MEPQSVPRKLAAILAADVAGYSRLMGADEAGTLAQLKTHRKELTDPKIAEHHGRIVKTTGDGVLVEFPSVVNAVQCAVEIQQEMAERNADLPNQRRIEFRVGINLGDIIIDGDDIYGDGVNIAARLEGLAEPGGICISGTAFDQVRNKLEVGFEDLGPQEVKNIAEPVRTYRVRMEPGAAGTVTATKKPRPKQWAWAVAAAVVVVLLGGAAVWNFYLRALPPQIEPASVEKMAFPLPDKPSIAVLPFENLSGDANQEHLSDGLTETLITDLSKVSSLFLIARNSTFVYKGKTVRVQQVAQDLGVRYVVLGSVQRAAGRLRVSSQLIDATQGHNLWADRYDRDFKDVFDLQDEIVTKIVTALKVQLTKSEQQRIARPYTANLEAYEFFLQGRGYRGGTSKGTNGQARRVLKKAIELDPTFAAAFAELSFVHFMDWLVGWSKDPQALEHAFSTAKKAVSLDDSLPSGHANLGWVYLWKKQFDQSVAELERALALNPNYSDALLFLGDVLSYAGRPKEAISVSEKGMRLDPQSLYHYLEHIGHSYYLIGQNEKAIKLLEKSAALQPDFLPTRYILAATYVDSNIPALGRLQVKEAKRLSPGISIRTLRPKVPYKDPRNTERFFKALRKAGLPE
jgi:adenylate cyclase